MAISTLPLSAAEILPFPRIKKRGAKVQKGQSASVLQFPAQLSGDDLRARWAWLLDNHASWRTQNPDGAYESPEDWEPSARNLGPVYAKLRGVEFGEGSLRHDVREWQAIIRTRNIIKSWLRDQGADPTHIRSADSALALVYRCLAPEPQHCA